MSEQDEHIYGASAEVIADRENGKVITRYLHPETGDMVMEIHVDPDVARDLAFTLTKASIDVEEHQLPRP